MRITLYIFFSFFFFFFFWHYGPRWTLPSPTIVSNFKTFLWGGAVSHKPNPQIGALVLSLFIWVITFDLSGRWGPTSIYDIAAIALGNIWPRKPHHNVKVGIRSEEWGIIYILIFNYSEQKLGNEMFRIGIDQAVSVCEPLLQSRI